MGKKKKFNENFISEYNKMSHCMIDYRINGSERSKQKNIKLEKLCFNLASATGKNENYGKDRYIKKVEPILSSIIKNLKNDLPKNTLKSLVEANNLLKKENLEISDVSKMSHFSSLFGREQCYLSLTNRQNK